MSVLVDLLSALTVGLHLVLLGGGMLVAAARIRGSRPAFQRRLADIIGRHRRSLALAVALAGTVGSLYLSNVVGWEPCRLCWFQRIAMYPVAPLLATAIVARARDVELYILPLTMTGAAISLYHYAIQRVEQFHAAGCSVVAVSCSTEYTFYAGYVTVPLMAFTAFATITVLLWWFPAER